MPAIPLSFANTSHVKLPACLQFRCLTDGVHSKEFCLKLAAAGVAKSGRVFAVDGDPTRAESLACMARGERRSRHCPRSRCHLRNSSKSAGSAVCFGCPVLLADRAPPDAAACSAGPGTPLGLLRRASRR